MAIKLKCPEIIRYSPNRKTIVEFSLRRIFLFSQVNWGVLGIRGQTKRERCAKCRPRNESILAKWVKNVFCPFEKSNGKLQLVISTCGLSLRALEGWQANQCFPRLIVFFCGQIACKIFQANRFKIISFSFELQLTTRLKLSFDALRCCLLVERTFFRFSKESASFLQVLFISHKQLRFQANDEAQMSLYFRSENIIKSILK